MKKTIAVLPGDGIGPEVIQQAIKIIKSLEQKFDHQFELKEYLLGAAAMNQNLEPLPDETLKGCLDADAVLVGAVGDPKYDRNLNATVRPEHGLLSLRRKLEIHTNVRPIKSYRKLYSLSPLKEEQIQNVDLTIFRELTGGLYFGKKQKDELGMWALDECFYHKDEIVRVARLAFDESRQRRKKLTLVDKANILETGRLWRTTVIEIQKNEFPDIELDFLFIDNAAMQLILNPRQFDVILTSNLFGDILSDEASVIVGSIGLLPSGSYGEGDKALFEPIHGSYPQAAGRNIANPLASILSVAMMMEHFELHQEEDLIHSCVDFVIQEGLGTMDMAPRQMISCSALGNFIASLLVAPKNTWGEMRKNVVLH
ncbi:MAG: 3-isopropylmalate dehydrogenase [Saprospiraceae bacterium]